ATTSELIELTAWSSDHRRLSAEQAVAIERADLADVLAGTGEGLWRVQTGAKIGVVVGDDWELRVMPRLAVPKLAFLLEFPRDPNGWKREQASFGKETDLFSAIASGFSWHASWALDRGLLRSYER